MSLSRFAIERWRYCGVGFTRGGILKNIPAASTNLSRFWYKWLAKKFKIVLEPTGPKFESQEEIIGVKKKCVSPKERQPGSTRGGVLRSGLHLWGNIKNCLCQTLALLLKRDGPMR